jgi:hypothetical protein
MSATMTVDGPTAVQLRELSDLLDAEADCYAGLLELARQQGQHMRDQDLAGLAENTQCWQQSLPLADGARIRRERLAADLMCRGGTAAAAQSLSAWLPSLPTLHREDLEPAVRRVRAAVRALDRQNELNRRLAGFCLDLVEEEAAVFRRAVLTDPSGRYDGAARCTQSGPGGVLERQG